MGLFFLGFITCLVIVFIALVLVDKIIFQYGKSISKFAEKRVIRLQDASMQGADIIYPKKSEEIFNAEGTTIDNLLV